MFLPLLFAHLVADFILQPSKLIQWKFKSWKGVAVHAGVHFSVSLTVLLPFLSDWKVWTGLSGIALSHFLVDRWKVHHELHNHHYVSSFMTDQLLHFSFLGLAALFIGEPKWHFPDLQNFYALTFIWIGLISMLMASFVVEVFLYQFARQKTNAAFKPDYKALVARGVAVVILCFIAVLFQK